MEHKNMKQIISEADLIGKTILKTFEDDSFYIIFTDRTFAKFYSYDYSESVYLNENKISLVPDKYNMSLLNELGIVSDAELKEFNEAERSRNFESAENAEIAKLKALKAKYPHI